MIAGGPTVADRGRSRRGPPFAGRCTMTAAEAKVAGAMSKDGQQHRGGLVPVGDIPFDVPGVGRKLTAKRQARHFTRLDQVAQLVGARAADPELGFMARRRPHPAAAPKSR